MIIVKGKRYTFRLVEQDKSKEGCRAMLLQCKKLYKGIKILGTKIPIKKQGEYIQGVTAWKDNKTTKWYALRRNADSTYSIGPEIKNAKLLSFLKDNVNC